ncbi:MAG TPA: type 2 isopentenyl-diphosphate Delta-isomerase [Aggregatilinea sp.]|uniref:type 2 isopentenyl-diphosphate Delta-isomerase n=1 Tax=Aggregatilinea sp. TaxID=2806333 RepID=UPI002C277CB0|nr:type 2 isopentenyl-diphosphate Delta-isomerase [Aggregatilinea sp.]HML21252.1 type 2 isopentenyl-diphosphate Delta-isomerase [Aggregatilinea sp.]
MSKVTDAALTERRKDDHIRINLEEQVQFPRLTTGLEQYRFLHQALPELDLAAVDTSLTLFGKRLNAPILISSMTGGTERAQNINRTLAAAAQRAGIAMGLGSMRAAIEDDSLAVTYQVREVAPDIMLFANLGAVQLNYGYGIEQCRRAVEMIEADALILHFNALQEAVQPEGDGNFAGLLAKVEMICRQMDVPVIAKEVGWGFSEQAVRQLAEAGVDAIDVAGAGGTSWSEVEYYRAPDTHHANVTRAFADWGIPTADGIRYARAAAPDLPVFASGGLRDGVDIAKCIAMGADLGGIAGPFLKAAAESDDAVDRLIWELATEIRIAMFASGAADLAALEQNGLLEA